MKIKVFEQDLHDKYDPPARAAVARWMYYAWGFDAIDNPDKYGVDLIIYKNWIEVGFAEVEVRSWHNECPFTTIHVPVRKTHMLEKEKTIFFALTQDMNYAYWIVGSKCLVFPTWRMTDETKDELYYDVPKELFNYVNLNVPKQTTS